MTAASKRILVVDDDATARLLMRAALRKANYEVSLADGGVDALRQFNEQVFDLVMLDVNMPDMNGFEVCAVLRLQASAALPILMVTGMDDVQSVEAAFTAGATDFISKPINWALIGHRVKYLLKGHDALLALAAAHAHADAILNAIPDLLFEVDIDGRYISCHSSQPELLAASPDHFIGKTFAEVLPTPAAQICLAALQEAQSLGSSVGQQYELELRHGHFWFELSVARKVAEPGKAPHFIVMSRDITERKGTEEKIHHLAFFDSLTGLPNRRSFLERVDQELLRARHKNNQFGVLFMDLDGFKDINDSMGHDTGDLALKWCADNLREAVRAADLVSRDVGAGTNIQIARLGGDEFTALILDIKRPDDALVVSNRILELTRQPLVLNGKPVMLTASIGIAFYPGDGDNATSLLKHADSAMYHAKKSGRNQCQFYNAELTEKAVSRITLENDLRLALERQEFALHYQPQIDPASGKICSAEALIQWHRPGYGLVSPPTFIAAAEQSGLIIPIGDWVIRTACEHAVKWQVNGQHLRVAVNLSPVQLSSPRFVDGVRASLCATGLPPDCLEFEITESTLMADTPATLLTLNALRDAGVLVTLDNFGTGYSSLSHLKRLPLGSLKVDQSFANGLPDDKENPAIVHAIVAMAKSLHLSVTAKGVETREQAQLLSAMGCNLLQGYYFGQPVQAHGMAALLEAARLGEGALVRDVNSADYSI